MERGIATDWNAGLYQASHSFVWEFGRELLALLDPRPGERILDLGCGTGQLTAEIARAGAEVAGVDRSAAMLEQARQNFPHIRFEVADATALPYHEEFDGVFSNAVLHWVKDAGAAVESVSRALKPRGRFVAEFGGRGNVRSLLEAVFAALRELGIPQPEDLSPWRFPSIAEYAGLLENCGLLVTSATLFDRPTPLEPGRDALANWFAMFGAHFFDAVQPEQRDEFMRLVEQRAAEHLLKDGVWMVDYRRIRIVAVKER